MRKSAERKTQGTEAWRPAPVPETASLTTLREAARTCTACPLYKNATQAVFGEGRKGATLMFLGEQHIAACRPWLEAKLRVVRPAVLVCLGSTAAQAIFGSSFRATRQRGQVLACNLADRVVATVHPSSILRQPDEESRRREHALFVADLRVAAGCLAGGARLRRAGGKGSI